MTKSADTSNVTILHPERSMPPTDFYRFKHTTWNYKSIKDGAWSAPLWMVGCSPFDDILHEDKGYVLHQGRPRFLARWTMIEEEFCRGKNQKHYFDEDLNILIYEVSLLDEFTSNLDLWLDEAVCAIAHSKGLISVTY